MLALGDVMRTAVGVRVAGENICQFKSSLLCRRRGRLRGDRHGESLSDFFGARQPEQIKRTLGLREVFLGDVEILHCGCKTGVPQQ